MKCCVVTSIGFVCRGELLSLRDIEHLHKKPKSDKETRLATAKVRNWHVLCPVLLGLCLSCSGGNAGVPYLSWCPAAMWVLRDHLFGSLLLHLGCNK